MSNTRVIGVNSEAEITVNCNTGAYCFENIIYVHISTQATRYNQMISNYLYYCVIVLCVKDK